MVESNKSSQYKMVECEVCLKEIPKSEAKSEEATDYIAHFCGLDCYSKWMEQGENKKT